VGRGARLLHESPAQAHYFQAVLETHRAGGGQRVNFPQRQAGGCLEAQRGHAFLEQLEGHPAHEEDPRLRVLGFGQLRIRPAETNGRQIVSKRRVGLVEPGFGGRGILREILAMPTTCAPCPANNNAVLLIAGRD